MFSERGSELGNVDAVGPDSLVEQVAGDAEFLRPVGDVGGDLGLDLVGVHGDLVAGSFFVLDGYGGGDDVGHAVVPLFRVLPGLMHGMESPLPTSPSFDVKSGQHWT